MKLDVADACQILDVDLATLSRWIREDELPVEWLNSQPFFHPAEVLEWATIRNRRFSSDICRRLTSGSISKRPSTSEIKGPSRSQNVPNGSGSQGDGSGNWSDQNQDTDRWEFSEPRLRDALRQGGIYYDVAGSDMATLLSHMVARLPLPADFDRACYCQFAIASGSATIMGIGGGIAVPHPLHPLILPGATASITLCFTQQAVPWNAFDNQPITALFTIVSPSESMHLQLLARVAAACRDLGILQCLRLQQSEELILDVLERYEVAGAPVKFAAL